MKKKHLYFELKPLLNTDLPSIDFRVHVLKGYQEIIDLSDFAASLKVTYLKMFEIEINVVSRVDV